MNISCIPICDRTNPDGMLLWFAEMATRDLIFHPKDSSGDICVIATDERMVADQKYDEIEAIFSIICAEHGDSVVESCYPVFMRKVSILRTLDS